MSFKISKILPDTKMNQLYYNTSTTVLRKGYIEIGDERIIMPEYYEEIAEEIDNFEVKDSDVFIISLPKTGTTWLQEMVWLLLNGVDTKSAIRQETLQKAPFLEYKSLYDYRTILKTHPDFTPPKFIENSINLARDYNGSPRLIKTHLPWALLPKQIRERTKKPKIIYISRNPKDTCISYYHHNRLLTGFNGSFDDFCALYLADKIIYGSTWNHISCYFNKRNNANFLFLTYEEMKADLVAVIHKSAEFLKKSLTQSQVDDLVDHLSFENMKKNYKTGTNVHRQFFRSVPKFEFMRRGVVGSYKDEMSPDMAKRFDDWTKKNVEGTELDKFMYF